MSQNFMDFIGIASPDAQGLLVNLAGQQLVGLDGPEQIHAMVLLDYMVAKDRERFQTEIWPTVMQHGYWEAETQFRHFKTGITIPMRHHLCIIKDELSP